VNSGFAISFYGSGMGHMTVSNLLWGVLYLSCDFTLYYEDLTFIILHGCGVTMLVITSMWNPA